MKGSRINFEFLESFLVDVQGVSAIIALAERVAAQTIRISEHDHSPPRILYIGRREMSTISQACGMLRERILCLALVVSIGLLTSNAGSEQARFKATLDGLWK